jgi:hypothetical protein
MPGVGLEDIVTVVLTQTVDGPVMGVGNGLTVSVRVEKHVPGVVYVIVTTPTPVPVATPVVGLIVAIKVSLLAHVPPASELLNVMFDKEQTVAVAADIVIAGVEG